MRKLMIASFSFAAGTAACHYLLPLDLLLYAALAAAFLGAAGFVLKGKKRLCCCIVFFSLACAFLYNFLYISHIEKTVEATAAEERCWTMPSRQSGAGAFRFACWVSET